MISWLAAGALMFAQDARELIETLRSDRIEEREAAARALRRLPEPPPELEKAAQDPDAEVAAQARKILRFFDLRRRLSPRLRAALPGVEERLAAGRWKEVLEEAVDPARRRGPLGKADLEALAGPALRQARDADEREEVAELVVAWRLRSGLPELVGFLSARDEETREVGVNALTELDAREVTKPIVELLGDARSDVRKAALEVLKGLNAREFTDRVAPLLSDPDPDVRAEAIDALREFRARAAAGEIRKRLADADEDVRSQAAWALVRLEDPEAASRIPVLLKDPSASVRRDAIHMLDSLLASNADPALLDLLQDPDENVRLASLHVLSRRKASIRSERLSALLRDENRFVRREALALLVSRGDPAALPGIRLLLGDPDAEVRQHGLHFLGLLKPREADAEVRRLLRDPEPAVRAAAARLLPEVAGQEAVPLLVKLLKDGSEPVVVASAHGLARCKAGEAVAPLRAAFETGRAELQATLLPTIVELMGDESIPIILKGLEDASPEVRGVSGQAAAGRIRAVLPAVERLLGSPRPEVRLAALQTVQGLPADERVSVAARYLEDPDASVRETAADILFVHGNASFAPQVRKLLAPGSDLREEAARVLGGWKDRESIGALRALLKDEEDSVKLAAVEALLALGAKEAASDLRGFLDAKEAALRGAALVALVEFGVKIEGAESLDPVLFEPGPYSLFGSADRISITWPRTLGALHRAGSPQALRELVLRQGYEGRAPVGESTRILRSVGEDQVMPIVLGMLSSPDSTERITALDTLALWGGRPRAREIARFLSDPNERVRAVAVETLTELEAAGHAADVVRHLADPVESVREVAAAALGHLGAKAAAPELRRRLQDAETDVVVAALASLGRLEAAESIPDVLPLLESPDSSIRRGAARALGELGAVQAVDPLRALLRKDEVLDVRETAARALASLGIRAAASDIVRALEEVEEMRMSRFRCGTGRGRERTPAAWRFEGEGPHPFNAVRAPELWERLREIPLEEDLEGTTKELAKILSQRAGLPVDVPDESDSWRRFVASRGGKTSLLHALDALGSDGYCLVLEPGRIRILRHAEGLAAWKDWWKSQASREPR